MPTNGVASDADLDLFDWGGDRKFGANLEFNDLDAVLRTLWEGDFNIACGNGRVSHGGEEILSSGIYWMFS